ncbi:MAG: hypothetical protein ACPGTP_01020 [Bacteroidia bacterium]
MSDQLNIIFLSCLFLFIAYQFRILIIETFLKKEEYPDDDERLYNPLTGKYYELDFENGQSSLTLSDNQTNILHEEDHSLQQKIFRFKEYLQNNGFTEIIEEKEQNALLSWMDNFELSMSIIDKASSPFYYKKDGSIYVLFFGYVISEIGLYTISKTNTFTQEGFIWPKERGANNILNWFSSNTLDSISSHIDADYHVHYSDPAFIKDNLSQNAIRLIESMPKLHLEFKDGHIILFQDEETTVEQLAKLRVLSRALE